MKKYDYIIIGAGISGSSVAFSLKQRLPNSSILIIEKLEDVGKGASGAAGAFLSPLLGKPNRFKDIVTNALKYSTQFYLQHTPNYIDQCGTIRIPKNKEDQEKFKTYIPYMDFEFQQKEDGYYFPFASVVDSYNICKTFTQDIEKYLNYEVKNITFKDNHWQIDELFEASNLILTTGASLSLIDEKYFNIRAVWGQRIVCQTSSCIKQNYHKECSVSRTIKKDENTNIVSIGATHHRFVYEKPISNDDTQTLLKRANNIITLKDIKVIDQLAGARASSSDFLPLVGEIINSDKTLKEFPYLVNGTNVNSNRFSKYQKLFYLNAVGGRGFVLAPYLAKILVDFIVDDKKIDEYLTLNRVFKKWVKKQ